MCVHARCSVCKFSNPICVLNDFQDVLGAPVSWPHVYKPLGFSRVENEGAREHKSENESKDIS